MGSHTLAGALALGGPIEVTEPLLCSHGSVRSA